MLGLVAGLLGETPKEMPEDRELSPVESSLAEYALQTLVLGTLQETWPGRDAPPVVLGVREPNLRWSRLFAPGSPMQWCQLTLKTPFGEAFAAWMVQQDHLMKLLGGSDLADTAATVPAEILRGRLEGAVLEMPVEVAVLLGSVELPLEQLAQLQVGDVIVLQQRVSDPLLATVAGEKKLRGWAGKVASRQAFRAESFLDG